MLSCSRFLKKPEPPRRAIKKALEKGFMRQGSGIGYQLDVVLEHKLITLGVFLATMVLAAILYATVPTGFFPQQDTGFIQGTMVLAAAPFGKAIEKVNAVADVIRSDPDVANVSFHHCQPVPTSGGQRRTGSRWTAAGRRTPTRSSTG